MSEGATPLLVATMRAHVPLALFFLEQGADPNIVDAGLTPLHWAATMWESGTANPVYGFDDPMEGHLPVVVGRERHLAHAPQQFSEGADTSRVDAQHGCGPLMRSFNL